MGQRVLLISTNRCTAPDPVFPLGLSYLSAALEAAGHEVRWYDVQADSQPLAQMLAEFRPQLVGISVRNIDDVLIRKQETFYDSVNLLCALVHEVAGCPAVLGGSGFSIFPGELLEYSGADFGVCGAGEAPLLTLLETLAIGASPGEIPGLVTRKDGQVRIVPPAHEPSAPPVHLGMRPRGITEYYLGAGGMLNLQTQRGCACHCCYCTYPVIEGRAHRRHPPDAVVDEFEQIQKLGGRYAFIVDSVFNSSARHVSEICEAVLRRSVKVQWGCFLRPQGLTPELMRLMARAGLTHIEFGSDSLSNTVLAAYQKGFTFDDVQRSSELARKEKVDFCHFLIAGGPGETDATLSESFERSKLIEGAVYMAVVGMRIYPGTPLHRRALEDGLVRPETNLLAPRYYLAPGLTEDRVFQRLQEFARRSPNWIVGDPVPGFAKLVRRLRQRGVVGPLWSYLPFVQRFWPAGTGSLPGNAPSAGPAD